MVDEPQPKNVIMLKSKVKSMLIALFNCCWVIMEEWVPFGQSVNAVHYQEILRKLRKCVHKRLSNLWKNFWILHHDDLLSHSIVIIHEFLAKNQVTLFKHPHTPRFWLPVTFFILISERCYWWSPFFDISKGPIRRIVADPEDNSNLGFFRGLPCRRI